ncbi:BRISC complex subunit FAM175B-like [Microplitis mediator]|uniref:BRISC complex subunit FAM175B-like n=1 Tax=Microplitis mediator TaxID=375433 RepID=UPI002557A61D|nr:BRISC complex subunit FAM175B-like [Microplitis mediator]XP_057340072.1 BRISC complex subunit FAM175B-like [Microplitis mediator]
MADDKSFVTISGAALSLLIYENVRTVGDQMGFFLGEVLRYVTKKVTDADRQVDSTEIHINIRGIMPLPPTCSFYNSVGKIDESKLKDFVNNNDKEIVGWYRFRLNNSLFPSLRDKLLHKQFENIFSGGNNNDKQYFVAGMLSYSVTEKKNTHKLRLVLSQNKDGIHHPVQLKINNLGADASRLDGSDYKPTPIKQQNSVKDHFSKFVDTLQIDFERSPAIDSIVKINKAAERHLDNLVSAVLQSDRELMELEKEIENLQKEIEANRLENTEPPKIENSAGETLVDLIKKDFDDSDDNIFQGTDEVTITKVLNKSKENSPLNPSVSMGLNNKCLKNENRKSPSVGPRSYSHAARKSNDKSDFS